MWHLRAYLVVSFGRSRLSSWSVQVKVAVHKPEPLLQAAPKKPENVFESTGPRMFVTPEARHLFANRLPALREPFRHLPEQAERYPITLPAETFESLKPPLRKAEAELVNKLDRRFPGLENYWQDAKVFMGTYRVVRSLMDPERRGLSRTLWSIIVWVFDVLDLLHRHLGLPQPYTRHLVWIKIILAVGGEIIEVSAKASEAEAKPFVSLLESHLGRPIAEKNP